MTSSTPHSGPPRFLSVAQVAELLAVSEDWVYERAKAGDLPSYKLPGGRRRFLYDELFAALEGFRQNAKPRVRR